MQGQLFEYSAVRRYGRICQQQCAASRKGLFAVDRFQLVYIVEYNMVGDCEIVDGYVVVCCNIISVDTLFVCAYIVSETPI